MGKALAINDVSLPPPPPAACTDTASAALSDPSWCLTQALWQKCGTHFMRRGTCDLSCGRCDLLSARSQAMRRTLLVSARQSSPCASSGADAWVSRAMQNKADYAQTHGMRFTWSSAVLDTRYDGAWNKVSYLKRMLSSMLQERQNGQNGQNGTAPQGRYDWLLWADWDVVFTDLAHTIPFDEYEARGARLVLGGDPDGIGGVGISASSDGSGDKAGAQSSERKSDYLKINSGVMAIRVHPWSLALLSRILTSGGRTPQARRRRAVEIQSVVANLCMGCIDDQAALLELLHREGQRWRVHTVLERRYFLQGFWEDFATHLPEAPHLGLLARRLDETLPLRQPGSPPLAPLRQRVHGGTRVPLSIHFAGCQLCSGKATSKAATCWPAFRRTLRFAEDQALRPLKLRHAQLNRSDEQNQPLETLEATGYRE